MVSKSSSSTSPSSPPLRGVRVLDFSRVIAGPLCTQQLADMGAEVIKVENPVTGDDARRLVPPGVDGMSHFFMAFNRNKRSLAIDSRREEARAVIESLLSQADVLVQNFRVGVMDRLGLGYEQIRERYPRLIYVSISAYGQTGPMSDRPGFDPVLQAEAGMMSLTGEPDGPALRHPLSIIDTLTALNAVQATLAALYARRDSGLGQHVDLALMDSAIAALGNAGLYYLCSGESPPRSGNSHMTGAPVNVFETEDGPLYGALATDRLFGQLCRDALERPDLAEDPRYATSNVRSENRASLYQELNAIFAQHPRAYWMAKMRHLPIGPVRSLAEALGSEEVSHREMVTEVTMASGDKARLLGSPLKFSRTPIREPQAPPELGQHTDEILAELGFSDADIDALRNDAVIR
jgi:crotonobetainyl-CoA:carnitine CoA-transferase CaiB-like acyl-CoA transferase